MGKKMWLASMLAAFLLTAGSVQAQSVNDKINALEQELQQLKEQQIELKKEATAAAAAMPSFSYRPGNGVNIEAADKAWGLRFTLESHFRYLFEEGLDQTGRTQGQMMGRRFRPGVFYCINNCLWEMEATLDLDGWGTGNGKNNQSHGDWFDVTARRGQLPWREPQPMVADRAVRHGSAKCRRRQLGPSGLRRHRRAGRV